MKPASTSGRFLSKFRTFDTLRYYRNFRFLWTGNLFYQVSWWMQLVVLSWLAYELTNSVFLVALFTAVRLFPTLLSPFAGAIADRVNRRKFLIAIQGVQIIYVSVLAILISEGLLEFWHLVLFGFLNGLVWSATYTSSYALAMDIVGKENVTNAIALSSVAMYITGVIGPTLGGTLIGFLGPANCFWVTAGLSVLAVITFLGIETPARATMVSEGSTLRNLAEGFNYVIHNRNMLSVLAVSFATNIFVWPAYQSFMPIFAKDNLGQGPSGLGFLLTAMGGGSLITALIIASRGNIRRKGLLFLCGTGVLALFFGIFAVIRSFPLALGLLVLAGAGDVAFDTMQNTITLILAPEDMRGRCMGFLAMAIGVYSFGALAMGAVANVIGASLTTAIGSVILIIVIVSVAAGLPDLRRLR